ncbi:MAG: hypothetical protein ACR2MP_30390 [Streptosporangiaceae bacterium]
MTLRIPAASIPPDLRYGAADVLADPAAGDLIGDVTLHAQGCLPAWDAFPHYLRYADREATFIAEGTDWQADLEACLAQVISEIAECGSFNDLDAAIIALDAVDRCFRESGLWAGNVYLAGTGALRLALNIMGDAPLRRGPEPVLRELGALELVYLFPIAGKFRSGAYDGQVQYRLNGWGRALAARLTGAPAGAARAVGYRRELNAHLARESERYSAFLSQLDVARQDYVGDRLADAIALPIPVLV